MKSDVLRRIQALEARTEPVSTSEESPKRVLMRKLGLLRPDPEHALGWEHYAPRVLALDAHQRLQGCGFRAAALSADLEALDAGTHPYPEHLTTSTARAQYRDNLARDLEAEHTTGRLLTDIRTTAGLDLGREVEPHSQPDLVPDVSNLSVEELTAMHTRRIPHPLIESETP